MGKTLVIYSSLTGNTRKIAESIFKAIPDNKELKNISEIESLDEYGLIFIGFPIYNFEPIKQAKEFLKLHTAGKQIALFMTMALTSAPSDQQTTELYKMTIRNCSDCAEGAKILGIFDCPGELSERAATALIESNDPQLRTFGMMRGFSVGFPNEKNIEDAELFAKKIYFKYMS